MNGSNRRSASVLALIFVLGFLLWPKNVYGETSGQAAFSRVHRILWPGIQTAQAGYFKACRPEVRNFSYFVWVDQARMDKEIIFYLSARSFDLLDPKPDPDEENALQRIDLALKQIKSMSSCEADGAVLKNLVTISQLGLLIINSAMRESPEPDAKALLQSHMIDLRDLRDQAIKLIGYSSSVATP